MCGATGPSPKTYSAVEMLEILVDIIEWKVDPSKECPTGDEYLSIQDMLDRAAVVIKREKGETCKS